MTTKKFHVTLREQVTQIRKRQVPVELTDELAIKKMGAPLSQLETMDLEILAEEVANELADKPGQEIPWVVQDHTTDREALDSRIEED